MDENYIAAVSARIVRMFQLYARNIDPEDEHFIAYISNYLAQKGVEDPTVLTYSELYRLIKDGIRQYLREEKPRPQEIK